MTSSAQHLLDRYLAAQTAAEAEDVLERILMDHARPLAERLIRSRLAAWNRLQDESELCHDALLALIGHLRSWRADRIPGREVRFEAFTSGIVSNVLNRHAGRLFPQRRQLRNRLRYVVATDRRLACWTGADGSLLCGLARLRGQPVCPSGTAEALRDRLNRERLGGEDAAELAFSILKQLPGPVDLTTLVSLACAATGVTDALPVESAEPSTEPTFATTVELRQWLRSVWAQIGELPVRQRIALLLSFRTSHGAGAWLIPELGVASFRELAEQMEMSAEELAAMWNGLPMSDDAIGERLGLDRQQVINLRLAARQRLGRRAKAAANFGAR